MKKLKVVFLFLIISFLITEILINLYIFVNKNKILKHFLANYKSTHIFYIFPNMLYMHKIETFSPNIELSIKNTFLGFDILKITKKIFVIKNLYSNNLFLEIKKIPQITSSAEEQPNFKEELKRLLSTIPTKIKINEVKVKYKNKVITINNVVRDDIKNDKINLFFTSVGKTVNAKFNFYSDLNKSTWFLKGNIFLSIIPTSFYHINFRAQGIYDLSYPHEYFLEVSKKNEEKNIKVLGKFTFLPIQIYNKIESNNLDGELKLYKKEDIYYLTYTGIFNITEFNKIKTLLFGKIFANKDYELKINLNNNNFMFNTEIVNNKGKFFVKYKDKIINGIIKYDNTKNAFLVASNQKDIPFDLQIKFAEKNNVVIQGSVFDYKTETYFVINKQNFIIKSCAKSNTENINFEFDTNYSTAALNTKYNNLVFGSSAELYAYSELSKNIIFDVRSNNFYLANKKLNFIAYGKTEFKKNDINYKIDVKDLIIDKIQVFKDAELSGRYKNNLIEFNVAEKDGSFYSKGWYNINKQFFVADIDIKRKNFVIGEIKTNLVSTLKVIKDKSFLISGEYLFDKILFRKQKIVDKLKGKIKNDKEKIILVGTALNRENIYPFTSIIELKTKKIEIKVQNFISHKYLSETINAEISFDLDSILKNEPIKYFSGRLYNSSSEIVISSSTYISDKNIISLAGRIKNLNIKNNNFVANFSCLIFEPQDRIFEINLFLDNFWINNYFIEKFKIKCFYNIVKKYVEFVDSENLTGKIVFRKNNVEFDNLKLILSKEQVLFCDGKIGNHGDVLKISIKKFPIETFVNIFNILRTDIKGEVDGNIEVISTMENKILSYKIKSNFVASNIEFLNLKMEQIKTEISSYKNYLTIKYFDVLFKPEQKISLKGSYNFDNEELDFFVYTNKCELSIFNNFYNIIKTAEGMLSINIHIKGKKNNPQLYGYLNISNGKINFDRYAKYLKNINLKLMFDKNKIDIINCVGEYEQTKIFVSGKYEINDNYSINIKTQNGSGIYISIPELSLPVNKFLGFIKGEQTFVSNGNLHFDINITKNKKEIVPTITGNIIMNNTYFTYPGKISSKKIKTFDKIFYDINLVANNNVWYENESILANIVGKVNFKYLKDMDKSNINGEVDATRGKVNFLNTYFNIKSGSLEIVNRDVYLELLAETDIVTQEKEKVNVQLVISKSKIEDIKPKLYSSTYPQLKTEDIAALMIGVGKIQKSQDKVEVLSSEKIDVLPLLRTQLIKLVDTTLATPVVRNVLQKWGIADNVVISQIGSDFVSQSVDIGAKTEENIKFVDIFKNTKYGIEKYLTSDMIIGYSITIAELQNKLSLKHEFEISYRIKNNIFIKGVYDYGLKDLATGRYGSDIKIQIEPRFKFKSWAEEESSEK